MRCTMTGQHSYIICVRVCVGLPAQELARHEEKVLLLEGGHQRAQEQLAERVAEVVRAEQIQRRLHADLRRVQQSLESSEQELHDCRCTSNTHTDTLSVGEHRRDVRADSDESHIRMNSVPHVL